jgi:CRP/FNR family transcriptional regulator, nitrogen fixation regulation protein
MPLLMGGLMNARVVAPRQLFLGTSEHQPVDFSKVILHGCNHSVVKNSVLAFRRGPIRYRRNAMIVCEGDPADYIYLVVKGTVRSCRTYQDGGRGIVAFYLSGEIFGLTGDPAHSLSLEAVTDTLILFFKRKDLLSAATRDIKIANYLLTATTNELRRIQEHSLMLGRLGTRRVATFLADLSNRTGKPKYLKLPMSLLDIADHLALKMETVSRIIAALEKSGSIVRSSYRTVILKDRASLVNGNSNSALR